MANSLRVIFTLFLHLLMITPFIIHGVSGHYALNIGFYSELCPQAESITKRVINEVIAIAPSLSGPLLRMFFHDCFVRVCIYHSYYLRFKMIFNYIFRFSLFYNVLYTFLYSIFRYKKLFSC